MPRRIELARSEPLIARSEPLIKDAAITPLAPEHVESFHRALDIVARERKYLTLLKAPPLPQLRQFVLESTGNGNPHFVALAEGDVIGWCDVRRHFFPAHAHRGTLGMGVVPANRRRGLGRRLLGATLEKAFDAGFGRIEFDVRADNARAIAIYETFGFVTEGIIRDAVHVDGEYRDAITMALVRRGQTSPP